MATIDPYNARLPAPAVPMVDPATGLATVAWWSWARSMFARVGGDGSGIPVADVQAAATAAANAAATAHAAAVTAQSAATTAQTAATAASAAVTAEVAARISAVTTEGAARLAADITEATVRLADDGTETAARIAADLLLAPQANPTFTGAIQLPILFNALNDAAAAAGGVAVGQLYRSGSAVMQRIV